MKENFVTCPLCSCQFYPSEHPGCSQCPLHKKCILICCPSCGYSIPITDKSKMVKWTSNLIDALKTSGKHKKNEPREQVNE